MGKNLVQQARGKGGPRYKAPSFRYIGEVRLRHGVKSAHILDIQNSQGHSTPVLHVQYDDGTKGYMVAPEGVFVGQTLMFGENAPLELGNVLLLKDIPEGSVIFNIEGVPGDGGKFCRTTGSFAKLVAKTEKNIQVMLPSKKIKEFHKHCRAILGVPAGAGRKEKPFLKAGKMHYHMKARNKKYPIISGHAQNAVDHPYGNKRSSRKSKARPTPANAPPGRKVGYLKPRRTGPRRKAKRTQ
jgi:large subunit ribosomal protein L2